VDQDANCDAKTVCDEIAAAFRDVPRPNFYIRFDPYPEEAERLEYLVDKTWLDIAGDLKYLIYQDGGDFLWMTDECFFYFFPGYLLGAVNHKFLFVDNLTYAILDVLSLRGEFAHENERTLYLSAKLTLPQKKAVAHWLQLQLDQDRERHPEVYEDEAVRTPQRVAFAEWREWA
jgi:hypothetical protein